MLDHLLLSRGSLPVGAPGCVGWLSVLLEVEPGLSRIFLRLGRDYPGGATSRIWQMPLIGVASFGRVLRSSLHM